MSSAPKTILVVDDEEDIRTYLSALLSDNGYKVITASDGAEGVALVYSDKPDLITLDITMPEKSGVRMYRELKENEEFKSIPVVIVTGVSDEFENFISSRRQVPPPEGYCHKPIDQKEILEKIAALVS
jgi:two-component system phosphate regulon response regulator PhoB